MPRNGTEMRVYCVEMVWSMVARSFSSSPFLSGLSDYVAWRNHDCGDDKQWPLGVMHTQFSDKQELLSRLSLWGNHKADGLNVLIIGAEGTRKGFLQFRDTVDDSETSLFVSGRELGDSLASMASGCGIMISACKFMSAQPAASYLLEKSGAQFLFGYTKDVDWITACMLEVALLHRLRIDCIDARPSAVRRSIDRVRKQYSQLWEVTGATVLFKQVKKVPRGKRRNEVAVGRHRGRGKDGNGSLG